MDEREAKFVQALKDLYHQTRPVDAAMEALLLAVCEAYVEGIPPQALAQWLDLTVAEVQALYQTYQTLQADD